MRCLFFFDNRSVCSFDTFGKSTLTEHTLCDCRFKKMEQTKGFYDFCIPFNKDDKVMRAILDELVELGYKTIAIDQSFDHSKKEAGKRGTEMFPEPHSIEHLRKEFADKLRILHRITILYVDVNVAHAMVMLSTVGT